MEKENKTSIENLEKAIAELEEMFDECEKAESKAEQTEGSESEDILKLEAENEYLSGIVDRYISIVARYKELCRKRDNVLLAYKIENELLKNKIEQLENSGVKKSNLDLYYETIWKILS